MDEQARQDLGARVYAARVAKGWGKERAGREAGVSSITWKRVEDGLVVHDTSLYAVLRAVGLDDAAVHQRNDPAIDAVLAHPTLTPAEKAEIITAIINARPAAATESDNGRTNHG